MKRQRCWLTAVMAALSIATGMSGASAPGGDEAPPSSTPITPLPMPQRIPAADADCTAPAAVLLRPVVSAGQAAAQWSAVQPEAHETPLAINLPTALRLAGARPVVIAAADASVQTAAAGLAKAQAAWLPNLNMGAGYYHHDGATQGQGGTFSINTKDQFTAGGGLYAKLDTTNALFGPLAARQVLRARQIDVQTARNEAQLATAEAYFNIQQARGRLAGVQDVVDKGQALAERARRLGQGLFDPTDVSRARTQLATF